MFVAAVGDRLVGHRLRRLLALLFVLGDLDRRGHGRGAARRAWAARASVRAGARTAAAAHRQRLDKNGVKGAGCVACGRGATGPPAAAAPAAAPWRRAGAVVGAGAGFGADGDRRPASRPTTLPPGTVPHGRRTLPAWTVTGSSKPSPPALIVTSVCPGVEGAEQTDPDSVVEWIGSSLGRRAARRWVPVSACCGVDELADFGVRGGECVFGRDPVRTAGRRRSSPGSGCTAPASFCVEARAGAPPGPRPPGETGEERRPGCGAAASPPRLRARVPRRSGSAALPPGATVCSLRAATSTWTSRKPLAPMKSLQLRVHDRAVAERPGTEGGDRAVVERRLDVLFGRVVEVGRGVAGDDRAGGFFGLQFAGPRRGDLRVEVGVADDDRRFALRFRRPPARSRATRSAAHSRPTAEVSSTITRTGPAAALASGRRSRWRTLRVSG